MVLCKKAKERRKILRAFQPFKMVALFPPSCTSVKAPERFQAMLEQRRILAEKEGLNPDVIEKLYRDLVNYFIDEELKHYTNVSQNS